MQKLYKKKDFRDNCGFGLIASIDGVKSRKIITDSINALISMTHRGGMGADGKTGDGCGLLVDINETYYKDLIYKEQKIDLEESFAIGQMFYFDQIEKLLPRIKKILKGEKLRLITYREVPINKNVLGDIALKCLPNIYQIFISPANKNLSENQFQTSLLQSRKLIEEIYLNDEKLYFCSFSSKTIIYKGLMLPKDIKSFYGTYDGGKEYYLTKDNITFTNRKPNPMNIISIITINVDELGVDYEKETKELRDKGIYYVYDKTILKLVTEGGTYKIILDLTGMVDTID